MDKEEIKNYFMELQDSICNAIEDADTLAGFQEDLWEREGGGGGRSRIIRKGAVIEKGGVGFSAVFGQAPRKMLEKMKLEEADFFASGVSIVMHPHSPMVPIIHMNVRYFEMSNGVYWFGGGIDLTPHYIDKEDAKFFHQTIKDCCDKHDPEYYPKFKKWADDYFFIKHRNETRGIGGIFFDRLKEDEKKTKEDIFKFVIDIGGSFAPVYTHFMRKNSTMEFGDKEKHWQLIRRSRYVEFNLVYDAGTKFGLDTNGRTESILMSMPPQAVWEYDYQPEDNSREKETQVLLQKGIDWLII